MSTRDYIYTIIHMYVYLFITNSPDCESHCMYFPSKLISLWKTAEECLLKTNRSFSRQIFHSPPKLKGVLGDLYIQICIKYGHLNVYVHMYAYVYICLNKCIYIYINIHKYKINTYVCTCICIYIYKCINIYVYVYIHIYIHIYMYIHLYMYIHMNVSKKMCI
jgi:hypothetical protein